MATLRFSQKTLFTFQTIVMLSSFGLLLLNQSIPSFIIASVLRGIVSGCSVGIDTLSTQVVTQKHINRVVGKPLFFRYFTLRYRHLDKFGYPCRTGTSLASNGFQ
jgi:hypothetical protein